VDSFVALEQATRNHLRGTEANVQQSAVMDGVLVVAVLAKQAI
jgi:hypothetical protein